MKTHHISHERLLLYLLEEATLEEREAIRKHTDACNHCAEHLAQARALIQHIMVYPTLEPDKSLLEKCKGQLRESIRQEMSKKTLKDRFVETWESLASPKPVLRLATAAATLFLGVFLGRSLPLAYHQSDSQEAVTALSTSPTVTNFRIVPVLNNDDKIEIRFRAVREYSLRGTLDEADMQYALAYALVNESRDNIRLTSVGLLEESPQDAMVMKALKHAVEKDENPGVRLKAIKLLGSLPISESIKKILIVALFQDPNPGVRTEAADALTQTGDDDIVAILEKKAREDEYLQSLILRMSREKSIQTDSRSL